MMKKIIFITIISLAFVLILGACAQAKPEKPQQGSSQIANPASEYCIEQGGELSIEKRPDGGEYGVCVFKENRQCEEWAMMRGDCPVGGVKITGYITPAAVFCGITGGEYAVTGESGSENEQGTCTFNTGKICDVWEYYEGSCSPND